MKAEYWIRYHLLLLKYKHKYIIFSIFIFYILYYLLWSWWWSILHCCCAVHERGAATRLCFLRSQGVHPKIVWWVGPSEDQTQQWTGNIQKAEEKHAVNWQAASGMGPRVLPTQSWKWARNNPLYPTDDTWVSPKPFTRGCNWYHNDAPCSVEGFTPLLTKNRPWKPSYFQRSQRPQPRLWPRSFFSNPSVPQNQYFFLFSTVQYCILLLCVA